MGFSQVDWSVLDLYDPGPSAGLSWSGEKGRFRCKGNGALGKVSSNFTFWYRTPKKQKNPGLDLTTLFLASFMLFERKEL